MTHTTGKRHTFCAVMAAVAMFTACRDNGHTGKQPKPFAQKDTAITPRTAFNDLFLDSLRVEDFIAATKTDTATALGLRGFYNSRNYEFAWFSHGGLNEQAAAFWSLLNNFMRLSGDSALADTKLAAKMQQVLDADGKITDTAGLADAELRMTCQFFGYARKAYAGTLEPADLQWFIPRKKLDALALLDTVIANKGAHAETWEPLNPNYQRLKAALEQYKAVAAKGGWQQIPLENKQAYRPGDTGRAITAIKKRLCISGDAAGADTAPVYDAVLFTAIKKIQPRYGLAPDGIIGKQLITALDIPVGDRIAQMLVNLERMRWLPAKTLPAKIVVNIPEFAIHVFEGDSVVLEMPVVVGKQGTGTVIFTDMLQYVVFSPYWNVPPSIVRNEILPAIRRDPGYLARNNMEQTGTSGGLPVVRQKPGPRNSLGRVKFLFPNNYNIYFHDTPAKELFKQDRRAFSHGCIRLADPRAMAAYLLRDQPEWTPGKIDQAMSQAKEKWVPLKTPVPVYITYFTAWVDKDGKLNFRDDVYGHDKKMAARLFTIASL